MLLLLSGTRCEYGGVEKWVKDYGDHMRSAPRGRDVKVMVELVRGHGVFGLYID